MVFVTGQDEVKRLVKMLSETFPKDPPKEEEKKELDLDNFSSEPKKEDEEEKKEPGINDDLHLGKYLSVENDTTRSNDNKIEIYTLQSQFYILL